MSEAAVIMQLAARLDALEAQTAIRAVMTEYLAICDRLDASTSMDELGGLFTEDAVWEGRGGRYGAAFGRSEGRVAILAMLDRYREPAHFAFNAHFLTSETMLVAGDEADGRWLMLQTSTYAAGGSDLRGARLRVAFRRDQGRWRISRFATENLFSRATSPWNDSLPMPLPLGAPK